MTIKTPITLDLVNRQAPVIVHVVQLDENIRQIEARLTNRGAAVDLTGMGAEFRMAKPDGTYVYYDTDEQGEPAVTISGSVVTVTLVAAALQAAGDGQAQIDIYDGNGKVSSFAFVVRIHPSTVPDGAISETYVNALTALANRAETAATDAEAAQAAAEAAASGAVRFDISQALTSAQQTQARTNIGAVGAVNGKTGDSITLAVSDINYGAPVYTALSDISCSTSSTLVQVAAAMPSAKAQLILAWCGSSVSSYSGSTFGNAMPAGYGTLRVVGSTSSNGVCTFVFDRYISSSVDTERYIKNIGYSGGTTYENPWMLVSSSRSTALTLDTDWTEGATDTNTAWMKDGLVVINIYAKYSSALSPSSAVTLATLPTAYRPAKSKAGTLYAYNSTTPTIARAFVSTSGAIQILGTAAANANLTGCIVYPVAL